MIKKSFKVMTKKETIVMLMMKTLKNIAKMKITRMMMTMKMMNLKISMMRKKMIEKSD